MSGEVECTPLSPEEDLVPGIYILPPPTKQSKALFMEKLPFVEYIANRYNDTPVPPGTEPCSWSHTGRGFKTMTLWTHGFLFTLRQESLAYLIENPSLAEKVCDHAKYFLLFLSGVNVGWYYRFHIDRESWRLAPLAHSTPVIPRTATGSPGAQQLLTELSYMISVLFPEPVAQRILSLLKSKEGGSGYHTHCITLTPYLGELFDEGFLGLRPLRHTKRIKPGYSADDDEKEEHLVHFSVHWMQNHGTPNHRMKGYGLDEWWIDNMLETLTEYAGFSFKLCEIDAQTKQPITEGQERFLVCNSHQSAEDMFILLALRWTTVLAATLAGGSGIPECDALTEYEESSEYEEYEEDEESSK
ncbi:hypothetical protein ISF_01800 [Cordyceps fumosorosea ARSEF 2679]|uniref:Uncharacterized protein n=1 Tax=Cordyceps fumosorosea (strain ARSEF 2679) TaxID=1081104 RepID=A0A162MVK7_CORFA|nr:hypothetical protein ISF_01800 [Cordyceps fumosorosea ARSEF 2679]OAA71249.1 hypothetical protein ISF_01800 [Cordyceps fumosorosea ARSEF 2679]